MVFQVRQFQSSIWCLIISFFFFFLKAAIVINLVGNGNSLFNDPNFLYIISNIPIELIENVTFFAASSFAQSVDSTNISIWASNFSPISRTIDETYTRKKKKNGCSREWNLIIDKNERTSSRREGRRVRRKKRERRLAESGVVCVDLADRFCLDSYYSFYPSPASSSSRSPRARLFLPFKKKLAEPASRSQLARYRYYSLAWNGMSRGRTGRGKKRRIRRQPPLSLIIINGDRQFPTFCKIFNLHLTTHSYLFKSSSFYFWSYLFGWSFHILSSVIKMWMFFS